MTFANIPDELLNLELGEAYTPDKGFYRWTLRSELEQVNEDIQTAEWKCGSSRPLRILHFSAWTKSYILCLIEGPMGDQSILIVDKEPPKTEEKQNA
jgi:hypothetical protein